jgi:predicted cupin superfamily sugar epimerase
MTAQSNGTNGTLHTKSTTDLKSIKPFFASPTTTIASEHASESLAVTSIIKSLNLIPHIEGGYFAETDRAKDTVPSPFPVEKTSTGATDLAPQRPGFDPAMRNSSTSIFYYLTPSGPQGGFHRNKARTVHTLHKGRGKYVIIHADEPDVENGKKRVEVFTVGHDVAAGEKLQWIVEGGKFKGTFLLPDREGGPDSEGLLISETVVPGFEYCDHDFLSREGLGDLLGPDGEKELSWLLSPLTADVNKS